MSSAFGKVMQAEVLCWKQTKIFIRRVCTKIISMKNRPYMRWGDMMVAKEAERYRAGQTAFVYLGLWLHICKAAPKAGENGFVWYCKTMILLSVMSCAWILLTYIDCLWRRNISRVFNVSQHLITMSDLSCLPAWYSLYNTCHFKRGSLFVKLCSLKFKKILRSSQKPCIVHAFKTL